MIKNVIGKNRELIHLDYLILYVYSLRQLDIFIFSFLY